MEWIFEKDHYEFMLNGYKCEIVRHASLGHLCGYVHLPKNHPALNNEDFDVHGGITFNSDIKIGFDCAHSFDLVPKMDFQSSDTEYRNVEYVKQELESLTEQIYADEPLKRKIKIKLAILKHEFMNWMESKFF